MKVYVASHCRWAGCHVAAALVYGWQNECQGMCGV